MARCVVTVTFTYSIDSSMFNITSCVVEAASFRTSGGPNVEHTVLSPQIAMTAPQCDPEAWKLPRFER